MTWRMPRGFWAYLALQVPDILLAGIILFLAHRWAGLPAMWAMGLFLLWVAKDLAVYPLLRDLWRPPRFGPETLVGARGIAQDRLSPQGQVRLNGELWQAEALRPEDTILAGAAVVVRASRGLTLLVEAEGPPGDRRMSLP